MPKARRKDGVRRALRADLVLGSKPQSLARAKVVASEGPGAKNVEMVAGKQEPTAKRHAAPAGVEAARKRRATKRDRFLDKLRESKRELEVVKAVRSHGEALGNVSSLSEALSNSLSEIEALKPRAGSSKNKSRRQGGHQEEDEEGNAGTVSRKRLRNRERKQIQLAEVSLFKQVLNHPSMAQNPVAAVQEHLRQRLESESA